MCTYTLRITCARCGFQEYFLCPDEVAGRKECTGCIARDLVDSGLMYMLWNVPETDRKNKSSYRRESLEFPEELEDNYTLVKVLRQSKKSKS